MRKILIVFFVLSLSAFAQADAKQTQLEKELKALVAKHQGKIGFYAKNLRTGEQIALGADEPVPTASTIKLLAFIEAFHEIKDGKKKLDDEITLRKEDQVLGSG